MITFQGLRWFISGWHTVAHYLFWWIKVFWNKDMSVCLYIVYGCVCATVAEFSSRGIETYSLQSLKYLSGPSQKKFANLWFKQFKNLFLQLEISRTFLANTSM